MSSTYSMTETNINKLCQDTRAVPCVSKDKLGRCSCLNDASVSDKRKDADGNVFCPFYSDGSNAVKVLRCRRYNCPYQQKNRKGVCSMKEMYDECPWLRQHTSSSEVT